MTDRLNSVEVRVLGCLLEKEKTTPEYYPLTVNALTNACNQKSSRDPVMDVTQSLVIRALYSLKDRGIVVEKNEEGAGVAKYGHDFSKLMKASVEERAVLCILMLRGPQTAGEIKNRADRLAEFKSPAEVETILQTLTTRADGPFTILLPRQPGQKERRYAHLFSGEPSAAAASSPTTEPAEPNKSSLEERVTDLEKRIGVMEELIKNLSN